MAFTVDELDKQFALRISQLLHLRLIGTEDIFLHTFDVFILRLLVRQHVKQLGCLYQHLSGLLGDGQHLLHVVHEAHVCLCLFLVLESQLRIHIHVVHLHILDAVALIEHLSHLHCRHEGGRVHLCQHLFGSLLLLRKQLLAQTYI